MSASSYAWEELNRLRKNNLSGAKFQCSLFGCIDVIVGENGPTGVIPHWLQNEAWKHGFMVVGADYRTDTYTFEVL